MFSNPIINLVYYVTYGLIEFFIWSIIISAVASWLVAFNIVNPRNGAVYQILRMLDAVTAPVLAPFRRIIPPLGSVDITPIFAFLVLRGLQYFILPWLFGLIDAAVRGG